MTKTEYNTWEAMELAILKAALESTKLQQDVHKLQKEIYDARWEREKEDEHIE